MKLTNHIFEPLFEPPCVQAATAEISAGTAVEHATERFQKCLVVFFRTIVGYKSDQQCARREIPPKCWSAVGRARNFDSIVDHGYVVPRNAFHRSAHIRNNIPNRYDSFSFAIALQFPVLCAEFRIPLADVYTPGDDHGHASFASGGNVAPVSSIIEQMKNIGSEPLKCANRFAVAAFRPHRQMDT